MPSKFLMVKRMDQFIRNYNALYVDYPEVSVSVSLHHAPGLTRFHVRNVKTGIIHGFKKPGPAVRCANHIIATGED